MTDVAASTATVNTAPSTHSTMTKAGELRALLIRNFNDMPTEHFVRGEKYESFTAGLSNGTAARKLSYCVDTVPPGKRACPYHMHYAQEELFIILEGEGTLRVAGEMLPIKAGDMITIPAGPEYPHHILNTSDKLLKYLSLSTNEYPEVCEYPDSGKYGVFPGTKVGTVMQGQRLHRAADDVDYWDGEE
jgi:uncharacterized cupin superfamily protein